MKIIPLFLFGSLVWASTIQTIQLNGYPKLAEHNCEEASASLFKDFAVSGLKVIDVQCSAREPTRIDISVRIETEPTLSIYTSAFWPKFDSYLSCASAMDDESRTFSSETGLIPFTSYCQMYDPSIYLKDRRFAGTFIAIGKPQTNINTFRLEGHIQKIVSSDSFVAELLRASKIAGLPTAGVLVLPTAYTSEIWVKMDYGLAEPWPRVRGEFLLKVYLENNLPITAKDNPMRANTIEECEIQRQVAMATFDSLFTSPVIWFCGWEPTSRAQLYHLRVRPGSESFKMLVPGEDGEPFVNRYATFEECTADKDRIVTHYRRKLGDTVAGALCSWSDERTGTRSRMQLYIRRD